MLGGQLDLQPGVLHNIPNGGSVHSVDVDASALLVEGMPNPV